MKSCLTNLLQTAKQALKSGAEKVMRNIEDESRMVKVIGG